MFTSILNENQCHESVFFRYYWHTCTLYYTEFNTETTVFGLKREFMTNLSDIITEAIYLPIYLTLL